MAKFSVLALTALGACVSLPRAAADPVATATGLARHSFHYTGEWDHRKATQTLFVVRDGKVALTSDIPIKYADGTVQVVEVTPEKKVVWALSQWKAPDLGPASSIQLLDEPGDLQR